MATREELIDFADQRSGDILVGLGVLRDDVRQQVVITRGVLSAAEKLSLPEGFELPPNIPRDPRDIKSGAAAQARVAMLNRLGVEVDVDVPAEVRRVMDGGETSRNVPEFAELVENFGVVAPPVNQAVKTFQGAGRVIRAADSIGRIARDGASEHDNAAKQAGLDEVLHDPRFTAIGARKEDGLGLTGVKSADQMAALLERMVQMDPEMLRDETTKQAVLGGVQALEGMAHRGLDLAGKQLKVAMGEKGTEAAEGTEPLQILRTFGEAYGLGKAASTVDEFKQVVAPDGEPDLTDADKKLADAVKAAKDHLRGKEMIDERTDKEVDAILAQRKPEMQRLCAPDAWDAKDTGLRDFDAKLMERAARDRQVAALQEAEVEKLEDNPRREPAARSETGDGYDPEAEKMPPPTSRIESGHKGAGPLSVNERLTLFHQLKAHPVSIERKTGQIEAREDEEGHPVTPGGKPLASRIKQVYAELDEETGKELAVAEFRSGSRMLHDGANITFQSKGSIRNDEVTEAVRAFKESGQSPLKIEGQKKFCENAWLAAMRMGMELDPNGFQPSKALRERWAKEQAEREKASRGEGQDQGQKRKVNMLRAVASADSAAMAH